MTNEPIKQDPVEKFRELIASFIPLARSSKKKEKTPEAQVEAKPETPEKTEAKDVFSVLPKRGTIQKEALNALPKKVEDAKSAPPPLDLKSVISKRSKPKVLASKPDLKPVATPVASAQPKADSKTETSSHGSGYGVWAPRIWTTASIITLTFNIILAIILIFLLINVYRMRSNLDQVMGLVPSVVDLPGGLYENFEKMERANIQTNVVVEAMIPVKFDLQLNQQTNVILSQDVTITNALVTVNTGGLNISRANTTIVLPQGTTLPVNLSLSVPVDQQVPVTLNVPVNIPLRDTQLRDPFVGLQNVIKPFYCFLEPQAVNMDGQPVCQ